MTDVAQRFHENWLGLVQPVDGLVVSIPALVAAECMEHQPPAVQRRLIDSCSGVESGRVRIGELWSFLEGMLQLTRDAFDQGVTLPEDLQLYVPEGGQTLRPTAALRKLDEDVATGTSVPMDDSTPASRAGARYEMLLWQLPEGLALDKPETTTGSWEYPPSAKFDRLLRECRVPIGLLTNGQHVRLVYAPHGESSGAITFRLEDMVQVGGRPILDAFVMLLSDHRWFGAEPARRLPAILKDSRARQADVTNTLADQVFEALTILLQGFEAAAERDGDHVLREALAQAGDHVYNGLLTVLLRLVFVLYAEDRGLMPVDDPVYGKHLSVLALFESLQADHGAFPDTMGRRFGAYPRLLALFRAIFYGVRAGKLTIPPRRGVLFDPGVYLFLEGAVSGAPAYHPAERAAMRVPSVSDETIHGVLQKLLVLGGQRLSYRALEVEQIGSVYEALMGYHVHRCPSASVCLRGPQVWVAAAQVLDLEPGRRARWFEDAGLAKAQAKKLADALAAASHEADALAVLAGFAAPRAQVASAGALVIQPGEERRRSSSHYTPRSLTEPIVRRTLEPLIVAMGGEPPSEKLLRLKVCDPAMGSGAFLVAACRFLADQVVAAWTREGVLRQIVVGHEDPVTHARRLVAQRCLYGVDKNPFAVNLAKLSLWLETLAKDEPFTFVDHALKCGDSLVGLSIAQIKRFEWTPDARESAKTDKAVKPAVKPARRGQGTQLGLFDSVIERALLQAHAARRRLLELAEAPGDHVVLGGEKARLHEEAEHALERARVLGDVLVGAFFAHHTDKARLKEASERKRAVEQWLAGGSDALPPVEVRRWVAEIRETQRPFHWELEFPEVFWDERADPLEADVVNRAAWVDAVVGNPPFLGKNGITESGGPAALEWLQTLHPGAHGNADYSAHFFRRADWLLARHGTMGLIATNTIAQGDTRASGLQWLLGRGHVIIDASSSMPWPGEANVSVSVVHLAKGGAIRVGESVRLDGQRVRVVNSRLQAAPERPDPVPLRENAELSFQGSIVLGMGFVLTPQERDALVARDPRNAERIFPYLGGEEVNTSPTQMFDRYVISFGQMSLEEAAAWPDLLAIVREKVKPERDANKREVYRRYWWHFGEKRPALYAAIAPLARCLVTARVTKHLCFSFQPTGHVWSEQINVFALDRHSQFAVVQSRLHEAWARLLGSTLEDRLRYTASDCFETFPFPRDLDVLEDIGHRLDSTRAAFMRDANIGLTKTYNALKDPANTEPPVVALRELHVELDRAVLAAYGWSDIGVPAFDAAPGDPARQRFTDEVLDRLFTLNAQRAAQERRVGAGAQTRARDTTTHDDS